MNNFFKKHTEARVYALLAFIFGILFITLTPPFQSPDENSHFKKSYQLSMGRVYSFKKDDVLVDTFPSKMVDYITETDNYMGHRDKKYTFDEQTLEQYIETGDELTTDKGYSTTATFSPVYTAPAVGILTGRIFAKLFGYNSNSATLLIYFARVFSLVFVIIIIYNAIRLSSAYKKTMAVIGLSPMVLFLSSMVTYDGVLIAAGLLFFAIFFKLLFENKKILKWEIVLLVIIGIILLNVKTLYFVFFGLIFFIPRSKFNQKKYSKVKTIALILGIILVATILYKLPIILQSIPPHNQLAGEQTRFIITHPFQFLSILIENIIEKRSMFLLSMWGTFGLLDTSNPFVIIILSAIIPTAMAIFESFTGKYIIPIKIKLYILFSIIFSIISIFSAMYIDWTTLWIKEIGGNKIEGVQGRYFLPLLLPALTLFSGKSRKISHHQEGASFIIYLLATSCLTVSIVSILLRFWT